MTNTNSQTLARRENPLLRYLKANGGILIALAILVTFISIRSEYFWTPLNMKSLLLSVTTTALLGLGMMMLLITGYIDLSPGSTFALCAVFLCKMMEHWGCNFYVSLIGTLLFGGLLGAVSGTIIAYTAMPAFIVTLAMDNVKRGVAYLISGRSLKIYSLNPTLKAFGNGTLLGVPYAAWIILACCIIIGILLNRTVLGRHLYATGGNQKAAIVAGVNVRKTCIVAYIIMGMLAALAGCISASKSASGQPTIGTDIMSDAVAAAVLGGTAFSGGKGTVSGTITGVILIGVMLNSMNLMEISYYWQLLFKGILIVAAVFIDEVKAKNEGRRSFLSMVFKREGKDNRLTASK